MTTMECTMYCLEKYIMRILFNFNDIKNKDKRNNIDLVILEYYRIVNVELNYLFFIVDRLKK
jgi:hypothetical protein